jgi:hypothetical protein
MIIAQRCGKAHVAFRQLQRRCNGAVGCPGAARHAAALAAHVGLMTRPDPGRDRIDRVGGRQIERAEIGAAPGEVGDQLGDAHLAEKLATG